MTAGQPTHTRLTAHLCVALDWVNHEGRNPILQGECQAVQPGCGDEIHPRDERFNLRWLVRPIALFSKQVSIGMATMFFA